MTDNQMANGLEMRWTAIQDEAGEFRLVARWIDASDVASSLTTAAA